MEKSSPLIAIAKNIKKVTILHKKKTKRKFFKDKKYTPPRHRRHRPGSPNQVHCSKECEKLKINSEESHSNQGDPRGEL